MDIVERLKTAPVFDHYDRIEAAAEIERLREELEQAWGERNAAVAELANERTSSQAREAKLREALEIAAKYAGEAYGSTNWFSESYESLLDEALALPNDNTALKEYRKQVLLEAADYVGRSYDKKVDARDDSGLYVFTELIGDDPYSATRRAITRAAAEIGKI